MIRATGTAVSRGLSAGGRCKGQDLSAVSSLLDHRVSASATVVDDSYTALCTLKSVSYTAVAWRLERVSAVKYIKVDRDVIWVTPDMWERLMVMSNTEWVIN